MTTVMAIHMLSTPQGILEPKIEYLNVEFGQSNVYHNSFFKQFWLQQIVNIIKISTQNAVNLMGKKFFN